MKVSLKHFDLRILIALFIDKDAECPAKGRDFGHRRAI